MAVVRLTPHSHPPYSELGRHIHDEHGWPSGTDGPLPIDIIQLVQLHANLHQTEAVIRMTVADGTHGMERGR
jgi:hypothetical protein